MFVIVSVYCLLFKSKCRGVLTRWNQQEWENFFSPFNFAREWQIHAVIKRYYWILCTDRNFFRSRNLCSERLDEWVELEIILLLVFISSSQYLCVDQLVALVYIRDIHRHSTFTHVISMALYTNRICTSCQAWKNPSRSIILYWPLIWLHVIQWFFVTIFFFFLIYN